MRIIVSSLNSVTTYTVLLKETFKARIMGITGSKKKPEKDFPLKKSLVGNKEQLMPCKLTYKI